jgi:hypothetical protein
VGDFRECEQDETKVHMVNRAFAAAQNLPSLIYIDVYRSVGVTEIEIMLPCVVVVAQQPNDS